jgi:hypothetical protein
MHTNIWFDIFIIIVIISDSRDGFNSATTAPASILQQIYNAEMKTSPLIEISLWESVRVRVRVCLCVWVVIIICDVVWGGE